MLDDLPTLPGPSVQPPKSRFPSWLPITLIIVALVLLAIIGSTVIVDLMHSTPAATPTATPAA
jgi:hypothetical protein